MALNPINVSNEEQRIQKSIKEKEFVERIKNKTNSILEFLRISILMLLAGILIYLVAHGILIVINNSQFLFLSEMAIFNWQTFILIITVTPVIMSFALIFDVNDFVFEHGIANFKKRLKILLLISFILISILVGLLCIETHFPIADFINYLAVRLILLLISLITNLIFWTCRDSFV